MLAVFASMLNVITDQFEVQAEHAVCCVCVCLYGWQLSNEMTFNFSFVVYLDSM